ncbi:hypothetical protein C8J56DRAFT_813832 [Mycena floridula]|nr:hypothetical protein C8J56DRAFT_813832 [Mycena floridula]
MSTTSVLESSVTVLGKRKTPSYILRVESSPEPSSSTVPAKTKLEKSFKCIYAGCKKSYTKPSRLQEHQRSHSGQRPYVCATCQKSYLRETHLQAHSRTHLPESARPHVCPSCDKRFWTPQHLRVHLDLHNGEKPFKCTEPGCSEAFAKHNKLRAHVCAAHAPPGTKPYRCEHNGCDKSFDTNQHLRTHSKIHNDKRYTCLLGSCAPSGGSPVYFSTWTLLQHHTRTAHPPTCNDPSCNGKTFSTQKGLRAHQKIHETRELEAALDLDEEPAHKKRRGGELGRDWVCDAENCDKDFKSKKALATHTKVTHLGERNYVCLHEDCQRAFGYKHLLQRHVAKMHGPSDSESSREEQGQVSGDEAADTAMDIDMITGKTYAMRSKAMVETSQALKCPYPDLDMFFESGDSSASSTVIECEYVFSRAYDLRRHLHSVHEVEVEKDSVEKWVKEKRLVRRSKI